MLGFSHITWPLSQVTKGGAKEIFFGQKLSRRCLKNWNITSVVPQCSHYRTCNNHLRSRQMPLTMLLGHSLLNKGIQLHITVRHCSTQSANIPLMTKRCIPFYRLADNGSITFWGRKWSSTQTTDPYSSYRHKGSYRMITIKSGPHIYNSFIWTSGTRREAPIMLQIASADHRSWW